MKTIIFLWGVLDIVGHVVVILTLLFARKSIYATEKPLWGFTFQIQQCGCQQAGIFCGRFLVRFDFGRCKKLLSHG